jgi:hypothetical protein
MVFREASPGCFNLIFLMTISCHKIVKTHIVSQNRILAVFFPVARPNLTLKSIPFSNLQSEILRARLSVAVSFIRDRISIDN